MSATSVLLTSVCLALAVGYLYGAYRYTIWWAVRKTELDLKSYPTLYRNDPERIRRDRRENLGIGAFPGVIWPIALLFSHLSDHVMATMPKSSVEQKAELDERESRIRDLERELGLNTKRDAS